MARAILPEFDVSRARRQVTGTRVVKDGQSRFDGGLNISADASQLAPNQVRRADNARLTVFGGIVKRGGSQNLHASAIGSGNPVRGGFSWIKDDGTQQLLAVSNARLHYGTYGLPMTWTQVASPTIASAAVYPSFAAFRDASAEVVYIADGGKLLKWDGATLARSSTTPSVSRIWVYNQRLYGVAGSDAILYASGLNDGDDLGVTSGEGVAAPIRTFGESSLVNGVAVGAANVLAHLGGLSRWQGVTQADVNIQAGTLGISPDVGSIVPGSLVATETQAFFLSDRGFYATDGYNVRRISQTLDPDILALFTLSANLTAVHHRFNREVLWYLPDTGFYAYNYSLDAWTGPWNAGYISPITTSAWKAIDSDRTPIVLVGGATGFVKQMDYPGIRKDNVLSAGTGGTTITEVVQLRRMFFGNFASDKALRFLYPLVNLNGADNAAVAWATSTSSDQETLQQTSGGVWGEGEWGVGEWGAGDAQSDRVQASGRGPYVDVTFIDSSTSTPPLLSAIAAEAYDYGEAHEYA